MQKRHEWPEEEEDEELSEATEEETDSD